MYCTCTLLIKPIKSIQSVNQSEFLHSTLVDQICCTVQVDLCDMALRRIMWFFIKMINLKEIRLNEEYFRVTFSSTCTCTCTWRYTCTGTRTCTI